MIYYQPGCFFFIYAFAGWCLEVIFHAVRFGRVINRGFLNGPVCPVYGFGVLLVFGVCEQISTYFFGASGVADLPIPLLYVAGVLLATFVELLGGVLLNTFFHARWWDYSDEPFNFHGYICLRFSLVWGAGIVLILRVLHPLLIESTVDRIPEKVGLWILAVFCISFVSDFIISVLTMLDLNKKLAELDELRNSMRVVSNRLSVVLGETAFAADTIVNKGVTREYEEVGEDNQANTVELREDFDEKYTAMQNNLEEKRKDFKSGVQKQRESLQSGFEKRRKDLVSGISEQGQAHRNEVERRMQELIKAKEEWIAAFNKKKHPLFRHRLSFNDIHHTRYQGAEEELRSILGKKENTNS